MCSLCAMVGAAPRARPDNAKYPTGQPQGVAPTKETIAQGPPCLQ